MVKLTEKILRKLSKNELIEMVLEMQKSGPIAITEEAKLSKQQEVDRQMEEIAKKRLADNPPRQHQDKTYKCSKCSELFVDNLSIFVPDLNDPTCKRCAPKWKS